MNEPLKERRFPFHVESDFFFRPFLVHFGRQDAPKTPQDAPRRPKTAPRRPQEATRPPQDTKNPFKMEPSWHQNRAQIHGNLENLKICKIMLSLQWGLDFWRSGGPFSKVKLIVLTWVLKWEGTLSSLT